MRSSITRPQLSTALKHPYRALLSHSLWRHAVQGDDLALLVPLPGCSLKITRGEAVAAAGSCFAQRIARHLMASGFNYLQTEAPEMPDEPVFSARFGNIYMVRQLRQLLLRAYGLHRPTDRAWRTKEGLWIDPFRPQMFPQGFGSPEDVASAREKHLKAVRRVFEECAVFIFTLALTETWLALDGTALPVPPGVVAIEADAGTYEVRNFTVAGMSADIALFLRDLREANPSVRVIRSSIANAAGECK